MIHATTSAASERALSGQPVVVRRIGPRALALLIGAELLLLVGVLAWALFWLLPPATPLASSRDITPVHEAIKQRLSGAVNDPLVEVGAGSSARASNLRGFRYGGEVYFYYVEGVANFDPLSRGAVGADEVEVLLRDESGPAALVIYRII